MVGIKKSFPGVQVLKGVDFSLKRGEVHALVGENGAGKTTLVNILNGVVKKDDGEIFLRGQKVDITSPAKARRLGIAYVTQELALVDQLTVKENIILGREPTTGRFLKRISWGEAETRVRTLLDQWGIELDPNQPVGKLSLAERQMVEIAKALAINAEIIVMDEPTGPLSSKEVEKLFNIIRALKDDGRSVIYISHILEEVFAIADRVTVLRDGVRIGTEYVRDVDADQVIRMMVGREIEKAPSYRKRSIGDVILEVEGLTTEKIRDITFSLREGEILGIAGLVGSGRTELLEALYGARRIIHGEVRIAGKKIRLKSPGQAIKHGLYYVPEDRRAKGLFLSLSTARNISASSLSQHVRFLNFISDREERKAIRSYIESLHIVPPSLNQIVAFLSGGNQQKVVIAKALKSGFKVLLMNDPTRGIDVGSKREIFRILDSLASKGVGILFVSSELDEIMAVADRVMVMSSGRVVKIFERPFSKEEIVKCMFTRVNGNGGK